MYNVDWNEMCKKADKIRKELELRAEEEGMSLDEYEDYVLDSCESESLIVF